MFACMSLTPAQAGIISNTKDKIVQNRQVREKNKEIKKAEKDIRKTFLKQQELSNKNDIDGLKDFYAENYRNSDAFPKDVTFKIIKDNYKTYPELKTDLKIKNIEIRDNYAIADVYESADMDGLERDDVQLKGRLKAFAHTIYYLKKINGKWLVTHENTIEENNSIIFGEAQYLDLKLIAPMAIPAGEEYCSTLAVNNLPRNALIMASIAKSPATYPMKEDDEVYRVLEDTELERLFTSNKNNTNEYVVSSVGITRAQPIINDNVKFYISGLAFLMTRVNVVPENNFIDLSDMTEEKNEGAND